MKIYLPLLFLILISCTQEENISNMNSKNVKAQINVADLKKIAAKKIYFGHQSVGYNIMDAITTLNFSDSGLIIKETANSDDFKKPVFAHSQNGENFKPETKILSFVEKMNSGLGDKVDFAFFKFCYVDINAGTDVNKLFAEYKNAMDMLIKKYPKTIFLHVTAPLTSENSSSLKENLKTFVKKVMGKKTGDVYDNLKRMDFNVLLRKEYGAKVFDLASVSSSDYSGKEMLSNKGGVKHQALLAQYTNDGGHLNREGGENVVSRLVGFIGNQIK